MPIDPNIALQARGVELASPIDMMGKALSLKQISMQTKAAEREQAENDALREAYKSNIGEGGVLNRQGVLSTLAKDARANPTQVMALQGRFAEMDANQVKSQIEKLNLTAQLAGSATDQPSYERAIGLAKQYGLDVSNFPTQYDPNLVKHYQAMALTQKDRLEQIWKEKDFGLRERDVAVREEEARIKGRNAKAKTESGEDLPIDKKKFVEALSTKNANKVSIKNQIDAVMSKWDSLSEDQKVSAGRQLLKTLNSTEGADAIGAEEANRLGAKLEWAMGNFTNSNPTQFGRDLSGFAAQARNTSKAIGEAVGANQAEIDRAYGRQTSPSNSFASQDQEAIKWAMQNPKDPRAAKILELNGTQVGGR